VRLAITSTALCVLIVFSYTPVFAQGGPPLITDDTGTPGPNKWEINIAMVGGKDGGVVAYDLPLLDINYGVGDNMLLNVEIPWAFQEDAVGKDKNGFDNIGFGFKWRFLDEEKAGVGVSFHPQYGFNTLPSSARRGLADDGFNLFLPFEIAKTFGNTDVALEIGYNIQKCNYDQIQCGLVSGWKVSDKADVVGELMEINDFHKNTLIAQVGTHWNFYSCYTLLFSVGRELKGDPNILSYLGLRLNL
jgi:hypothetical protein